jgi:hypothetical protein
MRAINITNEKKRDSIVGFEPKGKKTEIRMVLPDGRERNTVQFVKTLNAKPLSADEIIQGDPEIDIEETGRLIGKKHKMYLTSKNEIAYHINMVQAHYDVQGSETERHALSKSASNIAVDNPIQWTGKEFPIQEAVRKFVFTRNYQLRHTSGLTYDFLYDMAKQLSVHHTMMLVGGGKKGNEPIVLSLGGTPYRGFLEGRIDGDTYCLILHLSNMELRGV